MTRIEPHWMAKLNDAQKAFITTATGFAFYDEFLTQHGKHLFIFGTTGAGKTNKGYAFVDWLKHTETQIWVSSGKQGEIFPLLCMGKRVEILVPDGCDIVIEERIGGKWQRIKEHPRVIPVSTPQDMLASITAGSWANGNQTHDQITVLEIRNAFYSRAKAVMWVADFFEALAMAAREGKINKILPASLHLDESQWTIVGQRISNDAERNKASEVIAENALELRSAMVRLILYAQDYCNIPPAARENMLFNLLCRGADVRTEENRKLAEWCKYAPWRRPASPQYFATDQGRFVFESNHNGWGDSYPPEKPWRFRRYPLSEADREWCQRIRMRYIGKHDQKPIESEIKEECLPELGRFSAMAIPPEKIEVYAGPSRYDDGGLIQNGQ